MGFLSLSIETIPCSSACGWRKPRLCWGCVVCQMQAAASFAAPLLVVPYEEAELIHPLHVKSGTNVVAIT